MKKITIIFLLLQSIIISFAQNCSISGIINDAVSKQPLTFAMIRVLDSDSVLIAGTVTDTTGSFSLTKILCENLLCVVESFGYERQIFKINTNEQRHIVLSNIELKLQSKLLHGINVETEGIVSQKIDRTVYTITDSMLVNAASVLDIAKQIPEVRVDYINNKIVMKDASNCLILINGVHKEGQDINLSKINPSDIDKIEIIQNPSSDIGSQYDGVVNIILKAKLTTGYHFYSDITADALLHYLQGIIGFAYTNKKIRLNVDYKCQNNFGITVKEETRSNKSDVQYFSSNKLNKLTPNYVLGNVFAISLDYYINPKNYLQISTDQYLFSQKQNIESNIVNKFTNYSDSLISQLNNKEQYHEGNYTLFYRKTFTNPDQEFTLNFNAVHMNDTENNTYKEHQKLGSNTYNSEREVDRFGNRQAYNIKLDYNHPLKKYMDIRLGILGFYQSFQDDYQNNGSKTNSLYKDARFHCYTELNFAIKKVKFKIGFKAENYNAWQDTTIHYWSYLPSIVIQKRFNDKHSLRFNYRATSSYPSIWNFNKFLVQEDYYNYYYGNDNLKATTNHLLELGWTFRKKEVYLNTKLYAAKAIDGLVKVVVIDADNIATSTFMNVNGKFKAGNYTSFTIGLLKNKLELSFGLNLAAEQFNHKWNFTQSADFNMSALLPLNFMLISNLRLEGKTLTFQGYTKPAFYNHGTGVGKYFLDGKIALFVGYCYIPKMTSIIKLTTVTQKTIKNNSYEHLLAVKLICNFNKGKNHSKQSIENNIESEGKTPGGL